MSRTTRCGVACTPLASWLAMRALFSAPVACARGILGCLDDACCVGPFGIGLPDEAASAALVAAKKAWDAGGDADAFARAKVKVLAGAA